MIMIGMIAMEATQSFRILIICIDDLYKRPSLLIPNLGHNATVCDDSETYKNAWSLICKFILRHCQFKCFF